MNLSGTLSPALGSLSYLEILDFMWNKITGSIPKEIGNIRSLLLLLLNGNQLTGSLPEELGYLPNLDRIQIDENHISGPIPKSFVNLNKTAHFHMNNNSISGQIPPELSRLPNLIHLQLDNNNFEATTIPDSYSGMSHLLKLSLRNCRLQGQIPNLSRIPDLGYLNLVSLIGYCDEEGEQMLVHEFMSNGTMRDQLSEFDEYDISAKSKEPLGFAKRVAIALGSSKGILYLHTEADPPVFHRDIKASNILLDHKFTAKAADFGLSRLAPVADIEGIIPPHVSTVVKGTPGYLDPEYFLTRKLTDKSDVYSLGVVFLELLTGMQPIAHGKYIVREVNIAYESGMIFSVINAKMGSYPSECVEKFVTLALKCCKDETDARPSMAEVVRELESIWLMLPEADTKTVEVMIKDPTTKVEDTTSTSASASSSSTSKNPFFSSDVSGSNLVSGVIPTITPR